MPAQVFEKAADHTRPYGSHRYDVFAPKLRCPVTLFGREALDAWTALESNPDRSLPRKGLLRFPVKALQIWIEILLARNDGQFKFGKARHGGPYDHIARQVQRPRRHQTRSRPG